MRAWLGETTAAVHDAQANRTLLVNALAAEILRLTDGTPHSADTLAAALLAPETTPAEPASWPEPPVRGGSAAADEDDDAVLRLGIDAAVQALVQAALLRPLR